MPFDPTSDDPFSDPKSPDTDIPVVTVSPTENWVSFYFNSDPAYDRIGAAIHGEPGFVAGVFAIEGFDGKISTLMKRSVEIDAFFKKQYGQRGKS